MGIDPKIEQPTRKMLGHAIRHELDDLAAVVRSEKSETIVGSIPLCVFASAHIAIDVSDRWPTDADLRQISEIARGHSQYGSARSAARAMASPSSATVALSMPMLFHSMTNSNASRGGSGQSQSSRSPW